MMPEGTGRPRWDWFREMFGEPPAPPVADQCTETFSWLRSTFEVLPDHLTDEMVLMHARAYIWMLLSICLFGDKTGARAHSWIFWRFPLLHPPTFNDIEWPLTSKWYRYLPTSDEKDRRLQRLRRQLDLMPFSEFVCLPYRTFEVEAVLDRRILQKEHRALWCLIVPLIYFGTIEWHHVDPVIPQFGGVQNRPHPALNIDFLHAKDGRGSDQWFPQTFQRWHALWATSMTLFSGGSSPVGGTLSPLIVSIIYHPTRSRLRPHRDSHVHIQRTCDDNRRPAKRMMVGTRTIARDWQWLDDMMAEDAPAAPPTQKNRRMPVSYACRRGAGRPRRGGRAGRGRAEGVMRRLPSRLREVPAPVRRQRRRGQAHRLTSHPPLRPRGPRSRRP
ncbi:hypothetical protein PIB30_007254 [Stylosanthes scabra]|uniref:Aminotransferase-like plant mobile domain-containing protein n=1 Tax=Stylosanthes scabra TaxID=79078 RepID=A0ABU6W691_9FABA|nr:hypothetical protein [Stylosanthes scabra]